MKDMYVPDERDIELLLELEKKLDAIGFQGDITELGITPLEALMMDTPALARKINECTGIAQACADEIEARNKHNNTIMQAKFNSNEWSRF